MCSTQTPPGHTGLPEDCWLAQQSSFGPSLHVQQSPLNYSLVKGGRFLVVNSTLWKTNDCIHITIPGQATLWVKTPLQVLAYKVDGAVNCTWPRCWVGTPLPLQPDQPPPPPHSLLQAQHYIAPQHISEKHGNSLHSACPADDSVQMVGSGEQRWGGIIIPRNACPATHCLSCSASFNCDQCKLNLVDEMGWRQFETVLLRIHKWAKCRQSVTKNLSQSSTSWSHLQW